MSGLPAKLEPGRPFQREPGAVHDLDDAFVRERWLLIVGVEVADHDRGQIAGTKIDEPFRSLRPDEARTKPNSRSHRFAHASFLPVEHSEQRGLDAYGLGSASLPCAKRVRRYSLCKPATRSAGMRARAERRAHVKRHQLERDGAPEVELFPRRQ
ncbi:MAG: hypothetical protein ACO1OB_33955 [Archangium sp.]